jgi:hypothetical protein
LHSELTEQPISADNPEFIRIVESKIKQGEPIVILLRYSSQGGNRDYFLVKSTDEYHQVYQKANHRAALSVFFSQSFPIQGKVSDELKDRTINYLEKVIQEEDEEMIFVIRLDTDELSLSSNNIKGFSKPNQVEEWFQKNIGVSVIIGKLAFWENNSDGMITTYVKDIDGQIRRGAY